MELQEVLDTLAKVPAKRRQEIEQEALEATANLKWIPNPGPQTEAYFSKADVLLFGGEPGGGKTDLLLGLAFNAHKRSLLLRRQYTNLTPLLDGALRINGSREGYNGSPPPKLRISGSQLIEFGAAARPGDEQDWQGNPHDFIGIDETTQFLKTQVRFLMGWLRSTEPGQRCRVVFATNPPLTADGLWIVEMFAPWLDDRHPRPARPGELRWYITDEDGNDTEVAGPEAVMVKGRPVKPLSRTFIPSSVSDNPYLANTDYQSKLDAMIEPFRSILLGKFKA
ncbi:MAG: terminase, partial [Steroidobacteraceae bacterium]